jgi:predicted dienelactone hydrolase
MGVLPSALSGNFSVAVPRREKERLLRMKKSLRLLLYTVVLCLSVLAMHSQETISVPRSNGARVPLRVYAPNTKGCAPLVLLSPGAGGDENGLAYLAQGLQSHGWQAIVMGHKESGLQVLQKDVRRSGISGGLLEMTTDADAYKARFMDISAALAWAEGQCHAPARVLAGHSMGAATVMLEAGAKNKLGLQGQERFDAYVALSPQGPGSIFPEQAWSGIHKPVLSLTGTADRALEGSWQSRTIPFQQMSPGCKWLGVIDGATHMQFGGRDPSGRVQQPVIETVAVFLEDLLHHTCTPPVHSPISLQFK